MHSGHVYHINETIKRGSDAIVCAMSGNYVQRGEPAIIDKWSRAKAAIENGANLVAEIPSVWVLDGAGTFARAGVSILGALGCTSLSFGTEEDDIDLLVEIARLSADEDIQKMAAVYMSEGRTFPYSLSKVLGRIIGDRAVNALSEPNNVLAIEYLKAINELKLDMSAVSVKRSGEKHDSGTVGGDHISSKSIRNSADLKGVSCYLAEGMLDLIIKEKTLGRYPAKTTEGDKAVMSYLSQLSKEEIKKYCGSEDLSNRLYAMMKISSNVHELIRNTNNKSLTEAKVRRAVMRCFLRLDASYLKRLPPYINVLAADETGLEVLNEISDRSALPIVTKHSERSRRSAFAREIYSAECMATDLYGSFTPKFSFVGQEEKHSILIIRKNK